MLYVTQLATSLQYKLTPPSAALEHKSTVCPSVSVLRITFSQRHARGVALPSMYIIIITTLHFTTAGVSAAQAVGGRSRGLRARVPSTPQRPSLASLPPARAAETRVPSATTLILALRDWPRAIVRGMAWLVARWRLTSLVDCGHFKLLNVTTEARCAPWSVAPGVV
jgi:hypothetical protein